MNVIDSSAWLEYFADGPNAAEFELVITRTNELLVPSITIYEVFKRIRMLAGEDEAFEAIGFMMHGKIIELDPVIAVSAAMLSSEYRLPMADSIILATARAYAAVVWTQDDDFKGIEGVEYRPKQTSSPTSTST